MKKTLVAACLVAVASGLHAEESAGVKEISVADCKLPRVAGQLVYEEITRTGNMAKTMIAMLSTMQAISAKAPDSKRPRVCQNTEVAGFEGSLYPSRHATKPFCRPFSKADFLNERREPEF
jgi:hypothetical protein